MADRHCDSITGNDDNPGTALLPFKTMAAGVAVAKGFAQGDRVILHNDEVVTVAVSLPAMSGRATINSIIGVNKVTGLEDGSRIKITQTGNVSWLSAGFTYQWSFRNFLVEGFTAAVPLATTAAGAYGGAEWFNCKFSICAAISTPQLSSLSVFKQCIFEDIAMSISLFNTAAAISKMINCTFRRVVSTVIAYALLFDEVVDCVVVDSSFARYGVGVASGGIIDGLILDRITISGTGNVDNILCGNANNANVTIKNILATNIVFSNTPTTTNKAVLGVFASSIVHLTLSGLATWNTGTADIIKKTSAAAIAGGVVVADNVVALTETPWKNDDGVIANPMSCYEYKESYAWRRKNQLLTDVSGWSYPV